MTASTMPIAHSFLYEFFRDQGSIIAGILALLAGISAYWIGKKQISAVRDAMVSTERAFV
jgi:hypothetical protein